MNCLVAQFCVCGLICLPYVNWPSATRTIAQTGLVVNGAPGGKDRGQRRLANHCRQPPKNAH